MGRKRNSARSGAASCECATQQRAAQGTISHHALRCPQDMEEGNARFRTSISVVPLHGAWNDE